MIGSGGSKIVETRSTLGNVRQNGRRYSSQRDDHLENELRCELSTSDSMHECKSLAFHFSRSIYPISGSSG
jgi:hypothetical protein